MAKVYTENHSYKFICDGCGLVAGAAPMESIALQMARNTANAQGWQWSHPHWGLRCPSCRPTPRALDGGDSAAQSAFSTPEVLSPSLSDSASRPAAQ